MALITATMVSNTIFIANAATEIKNTTAGTVAYSEGNASITIKGNEGQSLVGKTFEVYQLFTAENAIGLESINYELNPAYENALQTVVGVRLSKASETVTEYEILDYLQSIGKNQVEGAQTKQELEGSYSEYRYFSEDLITQIQSESLEGKLVYVDNTKTDNSITITGLEFGYYMIAERSEIDGKHTAASMTMLSTANPESSIHIKSDYPTVIKKIQEDDNRSEIGEDGWNDIGDFEIGQSVPYRFQSTIPNINGYHSYYYAWHDCMDEALTFQKDTLQVQIEGVLNGAEKTYILEEAEYQLLLDTKDETFVLEIQDIKAIIDREFPNMNGENENVYGQQVTVSYQAILNDKAAMDTGRPGFENDVRLEYSNDPNEGGEEKTGFTPWDTVVCFTYKLEGIKLNNYGASLEGAEFALYTDEACTKPVYVKQVENRYHVVNSDSFADESAHDTVAIVSQNDGTFDICGLDGGTYYLKETKAPAGYRPLLDPIRLDVSPSFTENRNDYIKGDGANDETLNLLATAQIKMFTFGKYSEEVLELEVDQEEGSMKLSVINEVGKTLPVTGSYGMPVFIAAGVVFMGLAIKKGQKKNE